MRQQLLLDSHCFVGCLYNNTQIYFYLYLAAYTSSTHVFECAAQRTQR